ncbi:hypothetical protein Ancab_018069 [Ancistrocladus abbreviatus]
MATYLPVQIIKGMLNQLYIRGNCLAHIQRCHFFCLMGWLGISNCVPILGTFQKWELRILPLPSKKSCQTLVPSKIGVPECNNVWRDSGNTMLFVHPVGGQSNMIHGGQNLHGQALSLSLGTQIPSSIQISSVDYLNQNLGFSVMVAAGRVLQEMMRTTTENV